VIKSRRIRLAGHVARLGEGRDVYRGLLPSQVKKSLRRTRRSWGIILKLIFKKWDGKAWTGLIWLRIGTGDRVL